MRYADDIHKIMTKLYDSLLENYEAEENILRNGSNCIYESADVTFLKIYGIKLKRGGTYIASPSWISNKKATINPKNNKDECCFAWSIVAVIHHNEINHHSERISKLRPFIDNCNWTDINFPTEHKDFDKFEKNSKDVALNILSADDTEEKINIIYKSDFNRKRKHQVNLLMITNKDRDKWHYITVKNLSALLNDSSSNSHENHYCLNCLHAYRTQNALKKHERLCNNNKYCKPIMPEKRKKN